MLAAGKADFERSNRRRLFARIATGDYDITIVGHSSFGFIDLDQATEERYLKEELESAYKAVKEAEEEAAENGQDSGWRKPFGVKEAERLVKKIEDRLAKLRDNTRDRLLTWEEMGIDYLIVDEAHEFKNLAYSSRLTGVAGMGNKTGSQKAMDLHLKIRSLRERPGTAVAFLTGTPISNSVAEMYLVLRNLVPQEMKEMGIDNFDAWRSMYVSYASAYEPTEAGGLKEVTRLGREWTNMRSLMDLYYSMADAVTIEDIKHTFAEDNPGKKFPVPDIRSARAGGGDREMVAVQPTPEQCDLLSGIVDGFNGLPQIKDPKERNKERLRLMDRARKVSLDPRAVDPNYRVENAGGKIEAVADQIWRLYQKWDADKGTQLAFLDRSVPKAKGDDKIVEAYDDLRARLAKAQETDNEREQQSVLDALDTYDANEIDALRAALNGGWNAYDEIKRLLVTKGIPESEIRFVQEANTGKQKDDLFAQVISGEVRVLIGSTARMGAGTNVQDRLVAVHHVDVTWKPSDIEQREGRIVRQGNELLQKYGEDFEVEVIAYATERTIDAKMWFLNADKLKALNGIRKYNGAFEMEFVDEQSASMAEMAALATGNPLMVERVVVTSEIQKLELQQRSHNKRAGAFRDQLDRDTRRIENAPSGIDRLNNFADAIDAAKKGIEERSAARYIAIEGKPYNSAIAASAAAGAAIEAIRGDDARARYSIDVDGQKLTAKDQIDDAITEAFGTENFEAELDGVTYTGVTAAARAIAEKASANDGDDYITLHGLKISGINVEIDIAPARYSKYQEAKTADFAAVNPDGRMMAGYTVELATGKISAGGMRAGVLAIEGRLHPRLFRDEAERIQREATRAEKGIPGLKEQAEKPWDRAGELKEKRDRLKTVIGELSGAAESAQAEQKAETHIQHHAVETPPLEHDTPAVEETTAGMRDQRRENVLAEIEGRNGKQKSKGR